MTDRTYPTWLTGPNGERQVFNRAEDVPPGWVDGLDPSVRPTAGAAPPAPPAPPPTTGMLVVEPTASEVKDKAEADGRAARDLERAKDRAIENNNNLQREDRTAERAAQHAPLPSGWRDLSGPDMLKLAHDRGASHRVATKADAVKYLEGL